jgi:hypothetical protein
VWEKKYGGINQAALGSMMDRGELHGARIAWVDAARWNACYDPLWKGWRTAAVVHCKSTLRSELFGHARQYPELVREWRTHEAASG